MTKFLFVVFAALSLWVGYLTANSVGVEDTKVYSNSVRQGSLGHSGYRGK